MNFYKGNDSELSGSAQGLSGKYLFVSGDPARGMRFGLARRLLGAATGKDLLAPDLARMLDYAPKAVYKWESGEARPRDATVDQLAAMCAAAGLPITPGWLERGGSELPPIVLPPSALAPRAVEAAEEERVIALRPRAPLKPSARKKVATPNPRKRRGA